MAVSNGRISGTGLTAKKLQSNNPNMLSTTNYHSNTAPTEDTISNTY